MRTIYGLEMFVLRDITSRVGGRPTICNYLRNNAGILDKFEENEVLEIDTGVHGNLPTYNMAKGYTFKFVAIDLLEERLILDSFIPDKEEISEIQNLLVTVRRAEKFERMINKHKDTYERYASKYSGESLMEESCFMFIYDNDENRLVDVFIAIPKDVIEFLKTPITYKCSVCGKEVHTDNQTVKGFIPDFYYEITDDKNEYFCPEHKTEKSKHLGS